MKIEQIAFYSHRPLETLDWVTHTFGLTKWIHDEVVCTGEVNGYPTENVAKLWFNHEMGVEYEIIQYIKGPNWHDGHEDSSNGRPYLSHFGTHVEDIESEIIKYSANYELIQRVTTVTHRNPEVGGRRYRYAILGTRANLGWDLKLIQRVPSGSAG